MMVYVLFAYLIVVIILSARGVYYQARFVALLRKKSPAKAFDFGCLSHVPLSGILWKRRVRQFIKTEQAEGSELGRTGRAALKSSNLALVLFLLTPIVILLVLLVDFASGAGQ